MKIEIKHRYTGDIILCGEYESLKDCLQKNKNKYLSDSDLRGSDLSDSDLRGSNLSASDLSDSDLSFSDLSFSDLRGSDLSDSNLSFSDLSDSDLSGSNLRGSDLKGSNLSFSDLRGSDLSGSNLRGSNLRGAKTDKRYISISCIGSRKDMTTYCFEDDTIWCGCFTGTLAKFEEEVKKTHKNNPQYLKEYLGFIKYIRSLK